MRDNVEINELKIKIPNNLNISDIVLEINKYFIKPKRYGDLYVFKVMDVVREGNLKLEIWIPKTINYLDFEIGFEEFEIVKNFNKKVIIVGYLDSIKNIKVYNCNLKIEKNKEIEFSFCDLSAKFRIKIEPVYISFGFIKLTYKQFLIILGVILAILTFIILDIILYYKENLS